MAPRSRHAADALVCRAPAAKCTTRVRGAHRQTFHRALAGPGLYHCMPPRQPCHENGSDHGTQLARSSCGAHWCIWCARGASLHACINGMALCITAVTPVDQHTVSDDVLCNECETAERGGKKEVGEFWIFPHHVLQCRIHHKKHIIKTSVLRAGRSCMPEQKQVRNISQMLQVINLFKGCHMIDGPRQG